jgi:hypothetical protein
LEVVAPREIRVPGSPRGPGFAVIVLLKFMNARIITFFAVIGTLLLVHFALKHRRNTEPLPVQASTLLFRNVEAAAPGRTIPDPAHIRELPESERARIVGQGGLDSASYFDCWLTNRSSWTVTELVFRIAAGIPEGSTSWERVYRERIQLPPNTAQRVSFKITGGGGDLDSRWKITGARGVPSE